MRLLFIMMHPGYIRNYESAIRALAARGHEVHLRFNLPNKQAEDMQAERLAQATPGVQFGEEGLPKRRDYWKPVARLVRGGLDYLLYFYPEYANAPLLRARLELKFETRLWRPVFKTAVRVFGPGAVPRLLRWLRQLELSIPPYGRILNIYRALRPDLVLVTPLVNFASDQTDYFRAAAHLGIKTMLCVASWDNLTNKGIIRAAPDRVIVWNENQKAEAVRFHGIDPARVIVTGAQCYDKWFDMAPSRGRAEFCRKVGLAGEAPYLLYVCSSPFIAPDEVGFVRRWIAALRGSGGPMARHAVLVRPHPQNAAQWQAVDFADLPDVVVFPRGGANPVTDDSRADFFDSIYHSAGVVGINTSTMIESGILNKPVFTILDPLFSGTQEGTLHFHHLVKGGFLNVAASLEEHVAQLAGALDRREALEKQRDFVRVFVRPRGLDVPATKVFADEVEGFAASGGAGEERQALPAAAVGWILGFAALAWSGGHTSRKLLHKGWKKRAVAARWTLALRARAAALARKAVGALGLRRALRTAVVPFLVKLSSEEPYTEADQLADRQRKTFLEMGRSDLPVVVGPWLSEVGFEALYWIPFVHWVASTFAIPADRLIAVSRGGADPWYAHLSPRYVDLFSYFSQSEFRARNEARARETGGQKHTAVGQFDQHIVRLLQDSGRLPEKFLWLHPSMMYNLFRFYWSRRNPVTLVERHTKYSLMKAPVPDPALADLPQNYVAVKFYFSEAFPQTPENREFVARVLRRLSERGNVVLLNTGLRIDDHADSLTGALGRVHTIEPLINLRNNLSLQTQAVAGATALYGTYGGFSYLAPFFGTPSVSFFSREDKFLPVHMDIAARAFRTIKHGRFDKVKEAPRDVPRGRPEFVALNSANVGLFEPLFELKERHDLIVR